MIEPLNTGTTSATTANTGVPATAKPQEEAAKPQEKTARPQEKDVEARTAISRDDGDKDARNDGADKTQAPKAPAQSAPRARIGYSFEEKEPYIEILNPRTGDVIQRFPAENAENELRSFSGGDAGVFVDRVA